MNLREAYKIVTTHLLELAAERGEESLEGKSRADLAMLAMEILDDEIFTDKLTAAAEDYIEDHGDDIGLW